MILISAFLSLAALVTIVTLKVLQAFSDNAKAMERLCVRVMIMKGLPAHTAAPEEFTPSGISWGAYEAAKRDIPQVPDEPSSLEDEQNAADLRAQAEEAKRIWAATDEKRAQVDKRLAEYEQLARQKVGR